MRAFNGVYQCDKSSQPCRAPAEVPENAREAGSDSGREFHDCLWRDHWPLRFRRCRGRSHTRRPGLCFGVGVPAKQIGWVCSCGVRLPDQDEEAVCPECERTYAINPTSCEQLVSVTPVRTSDGCLRVLRDHGNCRQSRCTDLLEKVFSMTRRSINIIQFWLKVGFFSVPAAAYALAGYLRFESGYFPSAPIETRSYINLGCAGDPALGLGRQAPGPGSD